MTNSTPPRSIVRRLWAAGSIATVAAIALTGCQAGPDTTDNGTSDKIGISLIVLTSTNPYFVAMEKAVDAAADKLGVSITFAAGKKGGDAATQIEAIETAISRGDKGILIVPTDETVTAAIAKARAAGIYVIALDTVPTPPDSVDITFATDNRAAGEAIGQWAAGQLQGKKAIIGLVDAYSNQVASVDFNRDQGFLLGMGIELNDPVKNGDEAPTGKYTGGMGGDYEIVGNQAGNGDQADSRTAMEMLLAKNPNINVVYAVNEPAAYGAYQALLAAGNEKTTLLVTIDGGCSGVKNVTEGIIGATSQQYPSKMAELGMEAIVKLVKTGEKPTESTGLDFFSTGSELVTDKPVDGVPSIDSEEGTRLCWGE